MNKRNFPDTCEERLRVTEFVVEATSFERLILWGENRNGVNRVGWEDIGDGWLETVGLYQGRPACISLSWAILNGHPILFYDATSELVDHLMIEQWFKENCWPLWDKGTRRAHCDAMNFHHCLSHCKKVI